MSAAEAILAPLDAGRAHVLCFFGPIAPRLLADRELRLGVYGVFAVATASEITCLASLGVLVVASLVLGVPHLVADVRYLFVRNGLHRRAEVGMAMAAPVPAAGGTARSPGQSAQRFENMDKPLSHQNHREPE
jgi:hypothetical protein